MYLRAASIHPKEVTCVRNAPHFRNVKFHGLQPGSKYIAKAAGVNQGSIPDKAEVVVVGAGVAGLAAALRLKAAGLAPLVLEAGQTVGGRVQTDEVDGFLLDRGFQIFLTGYEEAQRVLDYKSLDLKPFYAGALVRWNGGFHRVADPLRHPVDGVLSLANPVGSVMDKVRVGLLRLKTVLTDPDVILSAPETSILEYLKAEGFSDAMINLFFRPFMGGIFFDRSLGTTSRLFNFVMRTLATGENTLPASGIGAVAQQMANKLGADMIRTGVRVSKVSGVAGESSAAITLDNGTTVQASRGVIVAVEGPEAEKLLGSQLSAAPSSAKPPVGTACLYFSARDLPKPDDGAVLYLNGEDDGIVNNCCFPSAVAPSYAPPGQALVSASTIGTYPDMSDQQLEAAVRDHLGSWFGKPVVDSWRLLRIYRIPYAQPNQAPPTSLKRAHDLGGRVYVAGDHRTAATLDAALVSGRLAADALLGSGSAK